MSLNHQAHGWLVMRKIKIVIKKTLVKSPLVPPLCIALAGKNKNEFIIFQDGFLDKLDSFEEIDEHWNGENE